MSKKDSLSKTETEVFKAEATKNLEAIRKLVRTMNMTSMDLGRRLALADDESHYLVEGFSSLRDWMKAEKMNPATGEHLQRVYLTIKTAFKNDEKLVDEASHVDPELLYTVRDMISDRTVNRIIKDASTLSRDEFLHKWQKKSHEALQKTREDADNPLPKKRNSEGKKPPVDVVIPRDDSDEDEDDGSDVTTGTGGGFPTKMTNRMDDAMRIITSMSGPDLQVFIPALATKLGEGFVVVEFMLKVIAGFSRDDLTRFLKEFVRSDEVAKIVDESFVSFLVAKMAAIDPTVIGRIENEIKKVRKRFGIE